MSRIEDALKKAQLLREIIKEPKWGQEPQDTQDNGINVLVISRDPHIQNLVDSLQSLSQAEIIASDDIAQGMNFFLEKRFIEMEIYELRFTARMLDNLCCYSGSVASDGA
jgi:hypothetical protein